MKPFIWVVGSSGMLGQAVCRLLTQKNLAFIGTSRSTDMHIDISDAHQTNHFAKSHGFSHIINCAAYTQVDACENNLSEAHRANAQGVLHLALAACHLKAIAIHISTDYVFNGQATEPYREDAPCQPINAYGFSKWHGEQAFIKELPTGYIVRTSWLYGLDGNNFVQTMLRLMQQREHMGVVADQIGRPTYCEDLAQAMLQLIGLHAGAVGKPQPAKAGIYHFANTGHTSWHGFANKIREKALVLGIALRCQRLDLLSTAEYPTLAKRPAYSVLATDKITHALGQAPRDWQIALQDYLENWQIMHQPVRQTA